MSKKIQNQIKAIALDAKRAPSLMSLDSLHQELGGKFDKVSVGKSMCKLTKEQPDFGYRHVILPFINALGLYFKSSNDFKRWPTVSEVQRSVRAGMCGFLDARVIEKRTRVYSIRKAIQNNPDWDSVISSRKGVLRVESRAFDFESIARDAINTHLKNKLKSDQHFEAFAAFAVTWIRQFPETSADELRLAFIEQGVHTWLKT